MVKNIPTILVIFGATGDLAEKKIIPSLWHLFSSGRLPERLSVIGFSRRDISDKKFKELVWEIVKKLGGEKVGKSGFSRFFKTFLYHKGTFEDKAVFVSLSQIITGVENSWGVCANKLFYLAVPPLGYKPILKNLAAVKLNLPCGGKLGWSRIIIEKPFGTNLATAKELQSQLCSYFKEEQIYRIDHYLFKEIVQGIENFRFSNNLFENIWDNTTIESIDIRLQEKIGVEERGSFYDSVGTLRDVGQNHLLSMLAAITMDYPRSLDVEDIRKNRASILETLIPWTKESLRNNTFRAQYKGYKNIEGVRPNSETETYFALKTKLLHHKWKGVPITMEAGKRMKETRKEIILTLKHPSFCVLCETRGHTKDRIVFRLDPRDEIVIHFWTKKPGLERILEERTLSFFLYEKETKVQYVEEYAKVLYHAIKGNKWLFVSRDEVEAEWKFTDPIIEDWKKGAAPLLEYNVDTTPIPNLLQVLPDTAHKGTKLSKAEIGIIGLGKMGANLARALSSKDWKVLGFNRTPDATKILESEGIIGTYSLAELVGKLSKPRTIWLMVPYQAVDTLLDQLIPLLEKGDTVIDGGNSLYKDSVRRAKELDGKGINFLDVGVSGGPEGARYGACLMVGGRRKLYEKYESLFKDLSVKDGYGYMGSSGAGHFVKMVHNGIEYGMMQAIAEGFAVLRKANYKQSLPFQGKLNLTRVADVYNHGSVVESRLVDWLKKAFELRGQDLEDIKGSVEHTGEGEWTIKTAKELEVKTKIIEEALKFRINSEKNPSYTGKILSALREQFGGHTV